jgi:hypothetical protein
MRLHGGWSWLLVRVCRGNRPLNKWWSFSFQPRIGCEITVDRYNDNRQVSWVLSLALDLLFVSAYLEAYLKR